MLLALHVHERPFDGLISIDDSMLKQPRELAVILQTNLTVIATEGAGHDPIKATGLLLTHLDWICKRTTSHEAQVWHLRAHRRDAIEPWELLAKAARHRHVETNDLWAENRLTKSELRRNPLRD